MDGLSDSPLDACLARTYSQLLRFVQGRLALLEFYEKLWLVGSGKVRSVSELVEQLQDFAEDHDATFNHPNLTPLKAVFSSGSSGCAPRWSPRSPSTSVTCSAGRAQASEFKALCARTAADHFARLQSFQRKCDAALVALVYDSREGGGCGGLGYRHPEERSPPTALQTDPYTAIVCCAKGEAQTSLWLDLTTSLFDPRRDVTSGRPTYALLGAHAAQSVFHLQISPCIILVVVFDPKRSERDSYVTSFMQETAAALRCSRIYLSLRPGAK
ncbi:KICSTOR complex protein C12orf66 homolog [Pollicipes pollicipes]|uniref:KICSTOR complex protein C12orf66 homolog n=1 Tax=Pollicipes pollicipes TaxID=41117 RepID=UPI001885A387|nr:KICSTOR complex protein C12orf66 homolog [Pollicipes pollicipes]